MTEYKHRVNHIIILLALAFAVSIVLGFFHDLAYWIMLVSWIGIIFFGKINSSPSLWIGIVSYICASILVLLNLEVLAESILRGGLLIFLIGLMQSALELSKTK